MRRRINSKGFHSRAANRTGPACAGMLRPETVVRALRPRTMATLKRNSVR